jgi:ankyrin repeat protein
MTPQYLRVSWKTCARKVRLLCLVILPTLLPSIAGAVESTWIYKLIGSDCGPTHGDRVFTGFRLLGADGIYTALHASVGCPRLTALASDNTTIEDLEISDVDFDYDVAVLKPKGKILPSREGYLTADNVSSRETLRVWGFPFAVNRILDTHLEVTTDLLRTWSDIGAAGGAHQAIARRGGSPSPTSPMISIDGHLAPGHSGAPLFNLSGRVVGIGNGGIYNGYAGIGLATPIWKIKLTSIAAAGVSDRLAVLSKLSPDTLFAMASSSSSLRAQDILRERGIDPTRDNYLKAAEAGDAFEVGLFIGAGMLVDTNLGGSPTALYRAASRGHSEVVQSLISAGANRSFVAPDGTSTMQAALKMKDTKNRLSTVKALLGLGGGPSFNPANRDFLESTIIEAIRTDASEVVDFLSEYDNSLLKLSHPDGYNLLHLAGESASTGSVAVLIRHGVPNVPTSGGKTPFSLAAQNNRWLVRSDLIRSFIAGLSETTIACDYLMQALTVGAEVPIQEVIWNIDANARGCDGDTPLVMAVKAENKLIPTPGHPLPLIVLSVLDHEMYEPDFGIEMRSIDFILVRSPYNGRSAIDLDKPHPDFFDGNKMKTYKDLFRAMDQENNRIVRLLIEKNDDSLRTRDYDFEVQELLSDSDKDRDKSIIHRWFDNPIGPLQIAFFVRGLHQVEPQTSSIYQLYCEKRGTCGAENNYLLGLGEQ